MANKRIEIEQYRYYVDLLAEDPNNKSWKRGITYVMVTAILFCATMMVLGFLSNSQAVSYTNVLDVPVVETGAPSGTGTDTGIPVDSGTQIDSSIPVNSGTPMDGGSLLDEPERALQESLSYGVPRGAVDGSLIAQATDATSTQSSVDVDPSTLTPVDGTVPTGTTTETPVTETKIDSSDLPQSTGVANLSNLATGANDRGLQLYMIALFIGLAIYLYFPIRKALREGKPK